MPTAHAEEMSTLKMPPDCELVPTWRKASSRERSEAIGWYAEKEKKTFLKKGE